MRTFPVKDDNGCQLAFEIDNMGVWLRGIMTLLSKIKGVTAIQQKKELFRGSSDFRVEFKYNDIDFVVWEPYGDSSRYWIGPKGDKIIDVTLIEAEFRQFNQFLTPKVVMWIILGIVLLPIFIELT